MTDISTKVILYTTTNCSACDAARADLTADGVDLEERNVMVKQEWYDEVLKYSISVPVILRDGKVEIGWKGDMGCPIF